MNVCFTGKRPADVASAPERVQIPTYHLMETTGGEFRVYRASIRLL